MRFIALIAITLLLAGCVPAEPVVTPMPVPSSSPLFATDADALAAATAAYAAYTTALDAAFTSHETSALSGVAVGDALRAARKSVAAYVSAGKHQSGFSTIDRPTAADLSSLTQAFNSSDLAQMYACLDVSGVDVIGPDGASVVDMTRASRYPEIVSLKWVANSDKLMVAEEKTWGGQNFCL